VDHPVTSFTECTCGTTQKLPLGVNTASELEYVPATSDNTCTLLSQNITTLDAVSVGRKLDVHESMHRDTTMKITNKMHYID
jgi:hypothetical protein